MSAFATLLTVRHPLFGEATAALDADGAWIALVPGKTSRTEVEAKLVEAGLEIRDADAATAERANAVFAHWYATGETPELRPIGTEFQKTVWAELMTIPRGATRTYGEVARAVKNGAPRAVGRAVGANKLGFFIPCHRVVATYGPGGYAWGDAMKARVLENEGVRLADMIRETDETPGRPTRHFPAPTTGVAATTPKKRPAKKPRRA